MSTNNAYFLLLPFRVNENGSFLLYSRSLEFRTKCSFFIYIHTDKMLIVVLKSKI